jgi:23S rRNA (adenine1618-N6)-methyltransferase
MIKPFKANGTRDFDAPKKPARKTLAQVLDTPAKKQVAKDGFHPRNRHRFGYDFKALMASFPDLAFFVSLNQYDTPSINFFVLAAVKALNKALLKHYYDVAKWDIPEDYLCPPIPGRADYIHHIADLLATANNGKVPTRGVKVLDIGVGANCVYPIIGHIEYGWNFVGSDIDSVALDAAEKNKDNNIVLKDALECRFQTSHINTFAGIVKRGEQFDISVCNPPFHSSLAEAMGLTRKKLKNLGANDKGKPVQNFGGQQAELWCKGGEKEFVERMIAQSAVVAHNFLWFTTLKAFIMG